MIIFDYKCSNCGHEDEYLLEPDQQPACVNCGSCTQKE